MPGLSAPQLSTTTLSPADPYAAAILATPGLVGYWPLDDTGTTYRDLAQGNTATPSNTVTQTGGAPRKRGRAGAAFPTVYTYTTAGIFIPASAALRPSTWTIEAWVKLTVTPNAVGVIACEFNQGNATNRVGFELGWGMDKVINITTPSAGAAKFGVGSYDGTTWHTAYDAVDSAAGQVQHLVGSYDGATLRAYKNGVFVASTAWAGPVSYTSANGIWPRVFIGRRHDSSSNSSTPGLVSDAAIYNRPLTDAEVRWHYELGSAI